MNTLVTGATGFIGKHLVPRLLEEGFNVSCLVRPGSYRPDFFKENVTWIDGDMCNISSLKTACRDADLIIHLAGIVKAKEVNDFFTVNTDGTKNLLSAKNKQAKLIFISSQAALGPAPDHIPLDENAPPRPVSAYGHSKLLAEQAIIESDIAGNYTIIRPPMVYGPEDRESLSIFRLAKYHVRPRIGFSKSWVCAIFVEDLVNFIILCVRNRLSAGETFHVNDGNNCGYSYDRLFRAAARSLDTWTVPVFIPKPILRLAARLNILFSEKHGKSSMFNPDKYNELTARAWLLSSRKAENLLGFKPKYAVSDGFMISVEWYRKKGLL